MIYGTLKSEITLEEEVATNVVENKPTRKRRKPKRSGKAPIKRATARTHVDNDQYFVDGFYVCPNDKCDRR